MNATLEANVPLSSAPAEKEVGLGELFGLLWSHRWLVISICAICVLAAGVAALVLPKKYEVQVLLSPVMNQAGSGGIGTIASSTSAELGGLASLAGLSSSGGGGAKSETLATLQSETLTERYIQDNDLLPVLYHKIWNPQQKRWLPNKKVPTLWKANRYFAKTIRGFKENSRTGLATMTITWTDPKIAADWANGLVKLTNDYLRDKAIKESEGNIAYLDEQIAKTNVVPIRNVLYSLMETEIKKQMLARGSEEYALKVIDAAVPPDKPVSPDPILWTVAAFFAGLLISSAVVYVRFIAGAGPK
jgi:LPS O-antigen subunit length determinant protein (WzzB/FepE family)